MERRCKAPTVNTCTFTIQHTFTCSGSFFPTGHADEQRCAEYLTGSHSLVVTESTYPHTCNACTNFHMKCKLAMSKKRTLYIERCIGVSALHSEAQRHTFDTHCLFAPAQHPSRIVAHKTRQAYTHTATQHAAHLIRQMAASRRPTEQPGCFQEGAQVLRTLPPARQRRTRRASDSLPFLTRFPPLRLMCSFS